MNRWMAGGVAGVLSAGCLVALAVPGLAQEEPNYDEFQGEADVQPLEPHVGDQVTVSDDTCFEGTTDLWWALRPIDSTSAQEIGQVPLADDGSWQVTFTAPDVAGDYLWFGLCLPPGVHEPTVPDINRILDEDIPVEILDEWGVDALLYYAMLVPVSDEMPPGPTVPPTAPLVSVPPTTPGPPHTPVLPPAARPATPVQGDPTFTG
jgi:hypothetical protein